MQHSTRHHFGPSRTPAPLKYLVGTLLTLNLLFVALAPHFGAFYSLKNPTAYLPLSLWGIKHFFFWQFATYIFVPPIGHGFSLAFLIYLAFTLYLFWIIGTSIWDLKGRAAFYQIFFGSTLWVGLTIAGLLYLTSSPMPFSGMTPAIYALLMAWLFLFPEVQFLVFLMVPVKAKWIVAAIAGIDLLSDLSQGNFIRSASTISGLLFGYFFALLAWNRSGPFHFLYPMDRLLLAWKKKMRYLWPFGKAGASTKIYDFKTGKAVDKDEEFLNKCLDKISKHGKKSLTFWEKYRMKRISKRKR